MSKQKYCGIREVPNGKQLGSPEHCLKTNQVRYYGIKKIDKNLLNNAKNIKKKINPIKEQLKLKKIQDDARFLLREFKKTRLILEAATSTVYEKKMAQKKIEAILKRKDVLRKRLTAQKKIVDAINF